MNQNQAHLRLPHEVVDDHVSFLPTWLAEVAASGHDLRLVHRRDRAHEMGASGYAECRTCGWAIWFVERAGTVTAHAGALVPCRRQGRGLVASAQSAAAVVGGGGV